MEMVTDVTVNDILSINVRQHNIPAYRGVEAAVGRKLVCNVSVECRNEREEHGISDNFLAMAAMLPVFISQKN